jgi:Ca-activated chloride channel family protein
MLQRFENPEYLLGLILIPVLIGFFWFELQRKRKLIHSFGDLTLISQLMPELSYKRPLIKFSIIIISLVLLIVAMANPQIGSSSEVRTSRGLEIMVALDVSNSMLAEDIRPNRLEASKKALAGFIDRIKNDKVGVVVFAGEAFVQLPLTNDYNVVYNILPGISTGSVPMQGTAIGKAIEACINSFSYTEEEQNKVLVVISDGEDHEEDAIRMASLAAERNIIIHTIGLGNPNGAPLPISHSGGRTELKKDEGGKPVVSKLNEDLLKEIANITGGRYQHALDLDTQLNLLITDIQGLETQELVQTVYANFQDKYPYLIFAALLFLVMDFLIGEGKRDWLEKLKKI